MWSVCFAFSPYIVYLPFALQGLALYSFIVVPVGLSLRVLDSRPRSYRFPIARPCLRSFYVRLYSHAFHYSRPVYYESSCIAVRIGTNTAVGKPFMLKLNLVGLSYLIKHGCRWSVGGLVGPVNHARYSKRFPNILVIKFSLVIVSPSISRPAFSADIMHIS